MKPLKWSRDTIPAVEDEDIPAQIRWTGTTGTIGTRIITTATADSDEPDAWRIGCLVQVSADPQVWQSNGGKYAYSYGTPEEAKAAAQRLAEGMVEEIRK